MGWAIFGLGGVLFSIYVGLRVKAKNPVEAMNSFLGFAVVVILVWLAVFIWPLPQAVRNSPGIAQRYWGPTIGTYRASTDGAAASMSGFWANLLGDAPAPAENPLVVDEDDEAADTADDWVREYPPLENMQYTVKSGDTLNAIAAAYGVTAADIRLANGLTGDLIQVGQVLLVPVAATVPVPTPEPETAVPAPDASETAVAASPPQTEEADEGAVSALDLSNEIQALQAAKRVGDIASAETLISYLVAQQPGNQMAVQVAGEIDMAQALKSKWSALGQRERWNFAYAAGETVRVDGRTVEVYDYVAEVLRGFEFEVVDTNTGLRSTKKETLTLRCTSPGWMYGFEFEAQRFLIIELYGARLVGDSFYAG